MSEMEDAGLEEGEIEDEEDEPILSPKKLVDNITRSNFSNKSYDSFDKTKSKRSDELHKYRRRSYAEKSPYPKITELPSSQTCLPPPLTRGGYWAAPPLLPIPAPLPSTTAHSPGSRVFRYLRNRDVAKSLDEKDGEVENRQPTQLGNRSVKRKAKSQHVPRDQQSDKDNYVDLLKKHKEIQKQLAKLKYEEEKSDSGVNVTRVELVPKSEEVPPVVDAEDAAQTNIAGNTEAPVEQVVVESSIEDSDVQIISVKPPPAPEVLDDDDLDALELRKMALESVVAAANKKAGSLASEEQKLSSLASEEQKLASQSTHETTKSSLLKTPVHSTNNSSTSIKRSTSKSKLKKHSPRKQKSQTSRASHRERRPLTHKRSVDRYGRQKRLHNSSSSNQKELEIRREEADRRRREAEKRRLEEKQKHFEERQKSEKQREEIQKILLLKSPAEQVERFLNLVQKESPNRKIEKILTRKSRTEPRKSQQMADNYEEVAMEIDSDNPAIKFIHREYPDGHRLYQDNDPKHVSKSIRAWFAKEGVAVMAAPTESPDLNPIELLWGSEVLFKKNRKTPYKGSTRV